MGVSFPETSYYQDIASDDDRVVQILLEIQETSSQNYSMEHNQEYYMELLGSENENYIPIVEDI